MLSITSSTDKTIRLWINETPTKELIVNNFIFDVKICNNINIFPNIVIVTVGANETIDFYQLNKTNELKNLIALKGHEDWIRSIDIHEADNGLF